MVREHWIQVGDCWVHYWQGGRQGPQVVFLHGGAADSAALSWGETSERLSSSFQVIAPDLPGYGESETPRVAYTVQFYVRFLLAFLDALGCSRILLAGLSMGGWLALEMALRHPDRVRGLILVDSAGLDPRVPRPVLSRLLAAIPGLDFVFRRAARSKPAAVRWALGRIVHRVDSLSPAVLTQVQQEAGRPQAGKAWQSFLRNELGWRGFRSSCAGQLRRIQIPVLLVHGSLDPLIPVECARKAHQALPNSRLLELPGCGHWPPREDPERFHAVLGEFLQEFIEPAGTLWEAESC